MAVSLSRNNTPKAITARTVRVSRIGKACSALDDRESLLLRLQERIEHKQLRSYALLVVGVNCFHKVIESLGHKTANALLSEVGKRLVSTVSHAPNSTVARLGENEFALLIADLAGEEDALMYAGFLTFLLKQPMICGHHQICIGANVGVAFGESDRYKSGARMIEDAYIAMHRAHSSGMDNNLLFSKSMREEAVARLSLESDLQNAISRNQFELHYQPKMRLDAGMVLGVEALLRWRHPQRGMISPQEFIPIAEEIGLISELGHWVAVQAIKQLVTWRRAGVVDQSATMAINISAQQFRDRHLLDFFAKELHLADLPFDCLALEVTESLLAEDSPCTQALLENIVAAGICLDLDDFGTGYSSLSYLHRFPFTNIKIDQSFVRRMTTDSKSTQLIAAIVALARALKMGVVAEGVETKEEADKLRQMGCPIAQGYLFSRPLPPKQLEPFLIRHLNVKRNTTNAHVFRFPPSDLPISFAPVGGKKALRGGVN